MDEQISYYITFVGTDDKKTPVFVEKEGLKEFFARMSAGDIYWNERHKSGFWIDLSKVRYLTISEREAPRLCVEPRRCDKLPTCVEDESELAE